MVCSRENETIVKYFIGLKKIDIRPCRKTKFIIISRNENSKQNINNNYLIFLENGHFP